MPEHTPYPLQPLQIIILAAGKGLRMKSEIPKVLHRLCGPTLLERVLIACIGLHPENIVVVVGHGEHLVREEIKRLTTTGAFSGINITPVLQSEQKGTGHAAQVALKYLHDAKGRVLILPGDVPLVSLQTLQQLVNKTESDLAFLSALHPTAEGFGRVLRDSHSRIVAIVEHRDCSPQEQKILEVNSSIYYAKLEFLISALGSLKAVNSQREFYLTDIVSFGVKNNLPVEAIVLDNHTEVLGVNSRYELSVLEALRRGQINRMHMDQGVTLENPASTYIDEDITIGADCFVGAGTRLRGKTFLSPRVVLDGDSFVTDSQIGNGTHIKFSCDINGARIGEHCQIGPFAHLRPGTHLGDEVRIGNFVETKKVEIKSGVKANHLSYLGDAYIEENVNIGAGTITCNFDGWQKHLTHIGENVFVGSNTSLVAPVSVGSGAIIGAGSTITADVPADALALGRARQVVVEGWARKKREGGEG